MDACFHLPVHAFSELHRVPVVDANDVPLGMVSARDALGQDMVQLERDLEFREHLEENIA